MLLAASKTRSKGSNRYSEVLVTRTPCFACCQRAENSTSNLLRTEIDGEYRLTPALLIAKGFSSLTSNIDKLKSQRRCVVSTILMILLAVVVVAFWVFDALHS